LVVDDLGDARRQPDIAEADPVAAAVVDEAEPVERVIAVVGDRAAARRRLDFRKAGQIVPLEALGWPGRQAAVEIARVAAAGAVGGRAVGGVEACRDRRADADLDARPVGDLVPAVGRRR
jgi:hypothetical protein